MKVSFSPPSITQREIQMVCEVLQSGWITTGPKTKEFEEKLSSYCGIEKTLCLNSATAGLELVLRLMDIGPGDEVITTPYTFAATANVILHCGAKPVFADIREDDFNLDVSLLEPLINKKTKAIIPVDFAGIPCDYQSIYGLIEKKRKIFRPKKGSPQENLGRIMILSDAAHSFGSVYRGQKAGSLADFSVFSFHAVKNLTTAEGGAVCFNAIGGIDSAEIYKKLRLLSLHGQSKDALDKFKAGSWFYTIETAGYKYNMTDIAAAIGIGQLERFDSEITPKRKEIFHFYQNQINGNVIFPFEKDQEKEGNYHLYPLLLKDPAKRNPLIEYLAKNEIAANVHFIPLPLHPVYERLGYRMKDYPSAFKNFQREISLPIYPDLTQSQMEWVVQKINQFLREN